MGAIPTAGPVGLVLSKLHGVKGNGVGFKAFCPGHDDHNPSLSIGEGIDGEALVYCFGGCPTPIILEKIGLTMGDLFPPREAPARKPAPRAASRTPVGITGEITRHEIRDPSGNLIAVHLRGESPDGKRVWWNLPDGTPGLKGKKTADLPLYGVERMKEAKPDSAMIVAEGEKATEALLSNGIAAVGTVTGAAGTPGDEALHPLLDYPVLLWPDADKAGREHMARTGAALLRLGHRDVRVIDWQSAPPRGDAADLVSLEAWRDDYDTLLDQARKLEGARPLFEPLAKLLLNPRRPVWFVPGLIETPATILFFGASGTGKTFIVTDLAGAAATNSQWAGRDVNGRGPVFYIAGEGRTGLLRRFQAWQIHHKVTIPPDRLYISSSRIELDEVGAAKVEQAVEECSKESGKPPSLIVIDTLARALPCGGDENTGRDIGPFVNIVDRIRDRFGCVAIIVHHTGHKEDKRARGHTSLKAAMDGELSVSNRGGMRITEWTKLKDLPEDPHPQEFALERVLIGAEEDGELISSAVVSWKGRPAVRASAPTTKTEKLGLETLRDTIEANSGIAVTADMWRPGFYAKHWGDNDTSKKRVFYRVRETLVSKTLIRINDGKYSI